MTEDRYETLEMILKSREDGRSWFDVLLDYIAQDCHGSETDLCTCSLQHMGGSGGTIEQCWKWLGVDDDKVTVDKNDLLVVLAACERRKCLDTHGRLVKECTWWEDWLASHPEDEDKEE